MRKMVKPTWSRFNFQRPLLHLLPEKFFHLLTQDAGTDHYGGVRDQVQDRGGQNTRCLAAVDDEVHFPGEDGVDLPDGPGRGFALEVGAGGGKGPAEVPGQVQGGGRGGDPDADGSGAR